MAQYDHILSLACCFHHSLLLSFIIIIIIISSISSSFLSAFLWLYLMYDYLQACYFPLIYSAFCVCRDRSNNGIRRHLHTVDRRKERKKINRQEYIDIQNKKNTEEYDLSTLEQVLNWNSKIKSK